MLPLLVAFLVVLGGAVPAVASAQEPGGVVALAALPEQGSETEPVLAGDRVLVARERPNGLLAVVALPADRAGAPVTVFTSPQRTDAIAATLDASPELAAVSIPTDRGTEVHAGPPGGPLALLRRERALTFVQVDGPRALVTAVERRGLRRTVVEPGRAPARLRVPARLLADPVLAGELVAYGVFAPGQPDVDEPRLLVVAEWRTGRVVRRVRLARGIERLHLQPDGRVLVDEDGPGAVLVGADGVVRRVSRRGSAARFAGGRIVFEDGDRLHVTDAAGRARPVGPRSTRIGAVDADAERVVWRAGDCLLSAPLDAPATAAPPPGPCPRSEAVVDDPLPTTAGADGRLPVLVRCVAAPTPNCTGRVGLVVELDGRGEVALPARAFRIPRGGRRQVVLRLGPTARAVLRRPVPGALSYAVRVRTVDPAGRVTTTTRRELVQRPGP